MIDLVGNNLADLAHQQIEEQPEISANVDEI